MVVLKMKSNLIQGTTIINDHVDIILFMRRSLTLADRTEVTIHILYYKYSSRITFKYLMNWSMAKEMRQISR